MSQPVVIFSRFVLVLAGTAALAAAPARAEDPQSATVAATQVVPALPDRVARMTVPVLINGQGPFQFVIDTGSDRTVISSELAERLGLPEGRKVRVHALGGVGSAKTVKIDTVQVSTNIAHKVEAAALPARNLGGDGLLGIDSLKNQRIVIDFERFTMRVEPSVAPEAALPESQEKDLIIVTARTRLGQLVMVDADANGEKVWVVVDTGAQNTIANSKLRAKLTRQRGTEIKPIEMVDVIGKTTAADYMIVGKLRIGGIQMGNAAIAFADVHPFRIFGLSNKPSMLLGIESLKAFRRVSVDFATRKVKFLMPDQSAAPREDQLAEDEAKSVPAS